MIENKATLSGRSVIIITPDAVGPIKNGGVGTACFELGRYLAAKGLHVTTLFLGSLSVNECARVRARYLDLQMGFLCFDDIKSAAKETYNDCQRVWPPSYSYLKSMVVRDYLNTNFYDFVFFQDYQGHGLATFLSDLAGQMPTGMNLILYVHSHKEWINRGNGSYVKDLNEFVNSQYEQQAIKLSPNVIAPSNHMREFIEDLREKNSDTVVIPYIFKETPVSFATYEGVFDKECDLVFFGRLEPRKGLLIFLRAVKSLIQSGDFKYRNIYFLGKPITFGSDTSVSAITRFLGTGTRYEILDNLDTYEARTFLKQRASNILVVAPSVFDNYPLAVMELTSDGIPFITTKVGGIPEMFPRYGEANLIEPDFRALIRRLKIGRQVTNLSSQFKDIQSKARSDLTKFMLSLLLKNKNSTDLDYLNDKSGVSIIIPCYNASSTLQAAIDSLIVAGSKIQEFEIILIDDCSSECENQAYQRISAEYDFVKLFRLCENGGPGRARNFGITHAKYNFLLFFDSDNIADADLISSNLEVMSKTNASIVTCGYRKIPESQFDKFINLEKIDVTSFYCPIGRVESLLGFVNCLGDTVCLCKKEVFGEITWPTLFDSREDWEFHTRAARLNLLSVVNPNILYTYIDRPSGLRTSKLEIDHTYGQMRIQDLIPEMLKTAPISFSRSILNFALGSLSNSGSLEDVYKAFASFRYDSARDVEAPSSGPCLPSHLQEQCEIIKICGELLACEILRARIQNARRIAFVGNTPLAKMLFAFDSALKQKARYTIDKNPFFDSLVEHVYPDEAHLKEIDLLLYTSKRHFNVMKENLKQCSGIHYNLFRTHSSSKLDDSGDRLSGVDD